MTVRVAVLASGSGTNLQALIDARHNNTLTCDIVCVVTDNPSAGAIERAERAGITSVVVKKDASESRQQYDTRLATTLQNLNVDLVVLAGFMRLLSMAFLGQFPMRVVNLHPALPGEFPGTHAIGRAFDEKQSGRTASGVMVHFVPDEGVDDGPVIATQQVPLFVTDSLDDFTQRMHEAEHVLIVSAVQQIVNDIESHSFIAHSHSPKEVSP